MEERKKCVKIETNSCVMTIKRVLFYALDLDKYGIFLKTFCQFGRVHSICVRVVR